MKKVLAAVLSCLCALIISSSIAIADLAKGSSGDAVSLVQEELRALGYLKGSADGHFGLKTVKAVKEFQSDQGLEASGTVTPETQAAIDAKFKALRRNGFKLRDGLYFGMSEDNVDAYLKEHDGIINKEIINGCIRYKGVSVGDATCDLLVFMANDYGVVVYLYAYPMYNALKSDKMMRDFDQLKGAITDKYGKLSENNITWKEKSLKGFMTEADAAALGKLNKMIIWYTEGAKIQLELTPDYNDLWFNDEVGDRMLIEYLDPAASSIYSVFGAAYIKPLNTDGL